MENILQYLYKQRFKKGIVPTIDRLKNIVDQYNLDIPKDRVIHIAGTNGKGSTGAFLKSILENMDYKVMFFTSPHINSIVERFYFNKEYIDITVLEKILLNIYNKNIKYQKKYPFHFITFFEYMTAAVLIWFNMVKPDYLILETGMGGRFDATNIVDSAYAIITSIGLDHISYLGDNIEKIAFEKGGIIKDGQKVIVGDLPIKAENVIKDIAKKRDVDLFFPVKFDKIVDNYGKEIDINKRSLRGVFQKNNSILATFTALKIFGNDINKNIIEKGLSSTFWPARIEIITEKPLIIRDVAHNIDGVIGLKESLNQLYPNKKIITILSIMGDKDFKNMVKVINSFSERIIFCEADNPRAAKLEQLLEVIPEGIGIKSPMEAFKYGKEIIEENQLLLITGSIFLMGSIKI